ncbi:ead/Ea22-like family protein [Cronobacter sakazakii]
MNTISNERLGSLQRQFKEEGFNDISDSEIMQLVEENLALRKERERAEPVYQCMDDGRWYDTEKRLYDEVKENGNECRVLYTTPPAPLHENVHYADAAEAEIAALRKRIAELEASPPAPVVPDDVLKRLLPDVEKSEFWFEHDGKILFEGVKFNNAVFDACRAAMLNQSQPVAETDTTAHQFESLAGKVVGGSDGFECTPVADLYELLTKCGECYDYTTSDKVAADWIKEGYSAREYVKLDRLQEALLFAAPEPCK